MDLERLLSGKFETNELVLEFVILAYNILRMIGQESIGRRGTGTKHKPDFVKLNLVAMQIMTVFARIAQLLKS